MKIRILLSAVLMSFFVAGTVLADEPGWQRREDGWYYIMQDGNPGRGWVTVNGSSYFLTESGRCLTDTVTPDGHYVDGSGAWYKRNTNILGVSMTGREKFASSSEGWNRGSLTGVQDKIKEAFGGKRKLKISDRGIEYVSVAGSDTSGSSGTSLMSFLGTGTTGSGSTGGSEGSETVLAALYREPDKGRFRLELKMKLDKGSEDLEEAAAYDYAVFKAMLYQVSSSPEMLEAAIYSAWQEENTWGINRNNPVNAGDSQVLYSSGDGFGRFYITGRSGAPLPAGS